MKNFARRSFLNFGSKILRDEIIGVINIDRAVAGNPTLEIFSARGFFTRVNLGEVPAFACRHYLLSNVLSGKIDGDLSLRLIDEHATILMSDTRRLRTPRHRHRPRVRQVFYVW